MRSRFPKNERNSYSNDDNFGNPKFNEYGREKKTVVSFQITKSVWNKFDELVERDFGKYKKSLIIEDLIRKYNEKYNNKNKIER